MAVSSRSVKDPPPAAMAADLGVVEMRNGSSVRAGAYPYDADDLVTEWHSHDVHQLLYAFEGIVELETCTRRLLLPPQQAAWIPAGVRHLTTLRRVRSGSVFFAPEMIDGAADDVRVLAAAPVIRETIDRARSDRLAESYFETLALLAAEWITAEAPLFLPVSADPHVAAAMSYTQAHLHDVTIAAVSAAAGMSERSFRRHFVGELGLTWQDYRLRGRLLKAMALLTERRWTVTRVAGEVGFASDSAFTRAFTKYTGETPRQYKQRVSGAQPRMP